MPHVDSDCLELDFAMSFFKRGCAIVRQVFSADEITTIAAASERLYETGMSESETFERDGTRFVFDGDILNRVVWCLGMAPDLTMICQDLRLVEPSISLLQSTKCDHIISQIHYKKPGDGVKFGWHQDSWNRRYDTPQWLAPLSKETGNCTGFVQTITAIDPMTLSNGPLRFIPGSPALGHLGDWDSNVGQHIKRGPIEDIVLAPGDVAFMHPYCLHASSPNTGTIARRVLINGYAAPGVNRRMYPGCGSGVSISL